MSFPQRSEEIEEEQKIRCECKTHNKNQTEPLSNVNNKLPQNNEKKEFKQETQISNVDCCQLCNMEPCHFYCRTENIKLCHGCMIKKHPCNESYMEHQVCVWEYYRQSMRSDRKRKSPIKTHLSHNNQKKILLTIGKKDFNDPKIITLINQKKKKKNNITLKINSPQTDQQHSKYKYTIISKKSTKRGRNNKTRKKKNDKTYRYPSSSYSHKTIHPTFSIKTRNMKKKNFLNSENRLLDNLNIEEDKIVKLNHTDLNIGNNIKNIPNNCLLDDLNPNTCFQNKSETIFKENLKTFYNKIQDVKELTNQPNNYNTNNFQNDSKNTTDEALKTNNHSQKLPRKEKEEEKTKKNNVTTYNDENINNSFFRYQNKTKPTNSKHLSKTINIHKIVQNLKKSKNN
ncbi:hypothetical protein M0812_11108 [Anaeramoeba flamelloides]|uniref:B box-type domain-containing protein n=1 Tax=Anaeramoeba flamelloides TaxID=1746091 RepID=A0AAV7ZZ78_9EUKA|nr:hypothetical protein M0812_11108 [Anaeramoeba flamelloides]